MSELDSALTKVMAEANAVFERLGGVVEENAKAAVESGSHEINIVEVAQRAGLAIDEKVLDELGIDRVCYCLPWCHWTQWFPYRPLWCWWWRRYPWYRCCPWWWYRCHRYTSCC
ncbi:MAG: hypothetical protein ETSY1_20425 [Candidatus Entotheonella factor]|uniref:Uncharacterized protein n=1 Tax=Entotheonella factor TaxID=1429438 RepID=W4LIS5_ENTF1|nr:MAG: hypothetical protein ETSY1_20425 [Candidatus Entotheonella factor]